MIQGNPYQLVAPYLLQDTEDAGHVGRRMFGLHVRLLQIIVCCVVTQVTTYVGGSRNINELSDTVRPSMTLFQQARSLVLNASR
jgi:hypothetical protein